MSHETNDPPIEKPDGKQIMMGGSWDQAFREVGIIGKGVFTEGGYTIRIGTRRDMVNVVAMDVSIVLPADKLRQALDVVDRIEGRGELGLASDHVTTPRDLRGRGLEGAG